MTTVSDLGRRARRLGRAALGRRSDWTLPRPRLGALPGRAWFGAVLVAASTLAGWWAFAGATGEGGGSVALGLFVGAASIVLMAWSFVLAVRLRPLERLFGGLDRMYQAHRWAGVLAVVLMFWHVRVEPEIEGGIRGAARSVAEDAEGLAGLGEYLLYGLVALSLVRWLPYRWWRWTHKLLGVPFAFAAWHFFTAEKPYANTSPWGWWFGFVMLAGLAAWLWRVVVLDMWRRGHRYEVVRTDRHEGVLELELAPLGRPLRHRRGQFAVLKIQERGLAEPHPLTIASPSRAANLRFFVKDLGDWSGRLQREPLVGSTVLVEGPYGEFEPLPEHPAPTLWVAAGVGITPFLGALDGLAPNGRERPLLVYCVRSRAEATALGELEAAAVAGRIDLHLVDASTGRRCTGSTLETILGELPIEHVAVCGPGGLVATVDRVARRRGVRRVETEAFDFRSGIGPDLSVPLIEAIAPAPASAQGPEPVPSSASR
ncbi:MAG: ferric reductase-like transmembrane domain-containing protein [Actinomycetota bacterium]